MKRHSYRDDPECMETIRRVQRQLIDTLDYAIKKQGYTRHDAALFAGMHPTRFQNPVDTGQIFWIWKSYCKKKALTWTRRQSQERSGKRSTFRLYFTT